MVSPYFDLMTRLISRWLPEAKHFLHKARLFEFPYRAAEVLSDPQEMSRADRDEARQKFFLPFDTIVVEDEGSVVLLMDAKAGQLGVAGTRYFMECLPLAADHAAYEEWTEAGGKVGPTGRDHADYLERMGPDAAMLTMGFVDLSFDAEGEIVIAGNLDVGITASPERVFLNMPQEWERTKAMRRAVDLRERERGDLRYRDEQMFLQGTLRNVWTAMREVLLFNTPNRFIVEDAPETYQRHVQRMQAKKRRKQDPLKRRVLRSAERPTYHLLTTTEIREHFSFPVPSETTPHVRRPWPTWTGRYSSAAGRTCVTSACWAGPSEIKDTQTQRQYRVLLNR